MLPAYSFSVIVPALTCHPVILQDVRKLPAHAGAIRLRSDFLLTILSVGRA